MASSQKKHEVLVRKKEDEREVPAASDLTNPEAFADGESDPKLDTDLPMDAAAFTTTKQHKEKGETAKKDNKEDPQTFKSAVIISGIVVAVIGAIFVFVKKLKEA